MGGKRKSEDERKQNINFRIPNWLIKSIKDVPRYNTVVEDILKKYFPRKD